MRRLSIDERRDQLADAGLALAVRDGVEAVTIRGVAAEAGVSLGIVHYCFESKDALLAAMGHRVGRVVVEPMREVYRTSPDAEALAHGAADRLWAGLSLRRGWRLLTFEFATAGARSPSMRAVAEAHQEQARAAMRGFLAELANRFGVRSRIEPDLLERIVTSCVEGVQLAWLVDQDDEAAIASFHALADYLLSVLEPEPAESPRTPATGEAS